MRGKSRSGRRKPPRSAKAFDTPLLPAFRVSPDVPSRRPPRPPRKVELSPGRRWLVETMQRITFGCIKHLTLVDGDPFLARPPRVYRAYRLEGGNSVRRETTLDDFVMKGRVLRLFEVFDEIGSGVVTAIEVRDGLPFGMTVEEPVLGLEPGPSQDNTIS